MSITKKEFKNERYLAPQFQVLDIHGNLVTCGMDGAMRTWKPAGSHVKASFPTHETPVRELVKIRRFAAIGGKNGRIKVWQKMAFDLQDPVVDL